MFYVLSIVIFVVILYDIRFFKKQDREIFEKAFSSSKRWPFFILAFILVAITTIGENDLAGGKVLLWSVFLSLYFLRREQYYDCLEERKSYALEDYTQFRIISDAFGMISIWFFLVLVFSYVVHQGAFLFPSFNSALGEIVLVGFFSSAILLCLIMHASRRITPKGFCLALKIHKPSHPFLKGFLLPAGSGLLFASLSSAIILTRSVQPETPLGDILGSATSGISIFLFVFLAIFVAPFIEEITFRGYFYEIFKRAKGKVAAFIFVSFIFAGMHYAQYWGDWLAILIITLLGFILTFFRVWTKTTYPSIVMHYFYNGGMVILPVVFLFLSNQSYFKYVAFYDTYDFATKETLLKETIQSNSRFSQAFNDLACLYAENNVKVEEALRLIDQAMTLSPNEPLFMETKIKVLYRLNKNVEALALKKNLLERYPHWNFSEYSAERKSDLP